MELRPLRPSDGSMLSAIADSRIEGYPPPDPIEQSVYDAYIRGEIKAEGLVEIYKETTATTWRPIRGWTEMKPETTRENVP
jgi:hypothetical protein